MRKQVKTKPNEKVTSEKNENKENKIIRQADVAKLREKQLYARLRFYRLSDKSSTCVKIRFDFFDFFEFFFFENRFFFSRKSYS